jgi:hypothetical protein
VVGLITDKTAYREEVWDLAGWCQNNNLSLNVTKTKQLIMDYGKRRTEHAPIHIDWAVVEQVSSSLVSTSPTPFFYTAATRCLLFMQSLYPYIHVHITSITSTNLYSCTNGGWWLEKLRWIGDPRYRRWAHRDVKVCIKNHQKSYFNLKHLIKICIVQYYGDWEWEG